MKKVSQTIHHGVWLLIAMSVGIGAAVLLVNVGKLAYSYADVISVRQQNKAAEEEPVIKTETEPAMDTEQYYVVGTAPFPELSARSYIVADITTGDILAQNGRKVEYPIASVTKMMTAVVAKMLSPETVTTTVSERAINTEGFRGGLRAGEEISIHDLMYPLLLVSSNDAAEAIAEHFDRDHFIKQMNVQSKFIGMKNTYFNDPSGLSQHNTATADDLFAMLQYIYKNHSEILDITDEDGVKASGHYWENKNRLKDLDPYYIGGKTGFTNAARRTGVGVFEVPLSGGTTRALGIVILGSNDRGNDITKLIQYVQKHIHFGDQESLQELYEDLTI